MKLHFNANINKSTTKVKHPLADTTKVTGDKEMSHLYGFMP